VHVDRDFEQRLGLSLELGWVVFVFVICMHKGRQHGSHVRPLSALMFSNQAAANPAGASRLPSLRPVHPPQYCYGGRMRRVAELRSLAVIRAWAFHSHR
jgi:hypothetical protein